VLPHGVTTVIADPHEIANVKGAAGIAYMLEAAAGLPLDIRYMLPSCVPALPREVLDEGVRHLAAADLSPFYDRPGVTGLGEMMDVPGVLNGESEPLEKIAAALKRGLVVDGHSPGLSGRALERYAVAGIKTDHECASVTELQERLRLGMYVALRRGSAARNLETLLTGVTEANARRCMLCTDDRHPVDILRDGHIDGSVRMAMAAGLSPVTAVRMATLNAAECYGLTDVGALVPGKRANMFLADSLRTLTARKVWVNGRPAAENGKMLTPVGIATNSTNMRASVRLGTLLEQDPHKLFELRIPTGKARVLCLTPHSLLTRQEAHSVVVDDNGRFEFSKNAGLLKIAVLERHAGDGRLGVGLLDKSYGLAGGAIATSVAHDAHNVVVAGDNDQDMLLAAHLVEKMEGGIAMVAGGATLACLPLPIGGLMSDAPVEEVAQTMQNMLDLAKNHYHISDKADAFMSLSFLSLPVIPQLRLTVNGLFDVENGCIVDIAIK
jgi:adenine deaminase